jgi:cation-transporting P-type ATPase F
LQGALDLPRPEAIKAVRACQIAGIEVKMITGDRIGTALAIGKEIGLIGAGEVIESLSGREIAALSDSELIATARRTSVFARVSPDQKLRLVRALQACGEVVAMTGDGVNDAPALRQADIGIAMGITGTEVAKEAADMVLTDDNFATIEAAIQEGRGVYDNIVKFVVWALPTNLSQGLVVFVSMLFGITLPILPLQILWINTTTVVLLGTGLAFEPKEPNIMRRSPRPPKSPLLDRGWVMRVILAGVFLCALAFAIYEISLYRGDSLSSARTSAVNAIVFGEIFLLLNCRSLHESMFALGVFSNPLLWLGIVLMVLLQLLFTYMPFMQSIFGTSAIDGEAWAIVLGTSLVMYLSIESDKWLRRVK